MDEFGGSVRPAFDTEDARLAEKPGIAMAFQAIVDVDAKVVFGYEALAAKITVPAQESIPSALSPELTASELANAADAVSLALRLDLSGMLMTKVAEAEVASSDTESLVAGCLAAARGFPPSRLVYQLVHEGSRAYRSLLRELMSGLKHEGFSTAIEEFGAPRCGLDLLAHLQPDAVKLNPALIRNIDRDPVQQFKVTGINHLCSEMGIDVVAVGVRTVNECKALRDAGLRLFQGPFFAPSAFEKLPEVYPAAWPAIQQCKPRRFSWHSHRGSG